MPPRFRAAPPDTLLVAPLDFLSAVYHRASGQSHLTAPPAPEILGILGREAMTAAQLLDRLRGDYDLGDADEGALAARLSELIETGLVEQLAGEG